MRGARWQKGHGLRPRRDGYQPPRGWRRSRIAFIGLALAGSLLGSMGLADDWRVRRVLVPADELSSVVEGQGSYLTVDREKFDRLMAAQLPVEDRFAATHKFSKAIFRGRLDEDGALRGSGYVELGPQTTAGSWLEVQPPPFSVSSPRWIEQQQVAQFFQPQNPAFRWPVLASTPSSSLPSAAIDPGGVEIPSWGSSLVAPLEQGLELPAVMGTTPQGTWAIERIGAQFLGMDWIAVSESAASLEANFSAPSGNRASVENGIGFDRGNLQTPASVTGLNRDQLGLESPVYRLSFPAAVATTFFLELPDNLRPVVEQGLVRGVWDTGSGTGVKGSQSLSNGNGNGAAAIAGTSRAATRCWRIDLGPLATGRMRLVPDSNVSRTTAAPLQPLRVEGSCSIDPGLIELTTTASWQDFERDELVWRIPLDWQPLPVVLNTLDGERRVVPQSLPPTNSDGESRQEFATYRVTGLRERGVQSVRLTIQQRYEFGASLSLQLPQFEGRWREGTLEIQRSPRLQISGLKLNNGLWLLPSANSPPVPSPSTSGAASTATSPSSAIASSNPLGTSTLPSLSDASSVAALQGATWRAEAISPDMLLELVITPLMSTIEGTALTTVQAEGGKVSATLQAWLKPVGEPTFQWRTPLSRGWLVDRVSASIPNDSSTMDAVESWDITAGEGDETWLEVRFSRAWPNEQPVQVTVEAHRPSFPSPLDAVSADELRLVRWNPSAIVRHWLALQSENPYRFVSVGERIPKQVLPSVDPRLETWFLANPTARLLDLGIDSDLPFSLRTELNDQIDVDIEISATLFDRSVRESVTLRCQPMEGRPNELNLVWDRAPRGEWEWSLHLPNQNQTLPVQILNRAEGEASVSTLAWGVGLSEPFLLEGRVVESWDRAWSPSLPRVSGARTSTGILTVVSMARDMLQIEADASARLPASVARWASDAQLLTVVDLSALAFPIRVTRLSNALETPQARPENSQAAGTSFQESSDIHALVSPTGVLAGLEVESWPGTHETRHRMSLLLGESAPRSFHFDLPPGARLISGASRTSSPSASTTSGTTSALAETDATQRLSVMPDAPRSITALQPQVTHLPDGRERWSFQWERAEDLRSVELSFVTTQSMPRMRGMLDSPIPEGSHPVASTRWTIHLPGSSEVLLPDQEPVKLSGMLLQRWLGFDVRWQPVFEPIRERRVVGIEIQPSRTDPSVAIVGAGPGTRLIVRRPEVLRWWCAAAILVQASVWLTLFRRYAWLTPAFAGIVALWVPIGWTDITWTMVPAAIISSLASVRWFQLSQSESAPGELRSPEAAFRLNKRKAAVLTGAVLLLALLGGLPAVERWARAAGVQQETGSATSSLASPISSNTSTAQSADETSQAGNRLRTAAVYIPLDADGNERRDVILVPRDFYDYLLRQAPQAKTQVPWIMESIRHTVEAEPNPFDEQTRLRLSSRYRVRTFDSEIDWPIPGVASSLTLQADQIQTNNSPARLTGSPDQTLRVRLEKPGVHEIVVTAIDFLSSDLPQVADWSLTTCLDSEVRINGLGDKQLEISAPAQWLQSDRLGLERRWRPGPVPHLVVVRKGATALTVINDYPLGMLTHLQPSGDRAEVTVWLSVGLRESLPDLLRLKVFGDWELQGTTWPLGLQIDSERNGNELSLEASLSQLSPRPNLIGLTLRSGALSPAGRYPLPVIRVPGANIVTHHLVWRQATTATWSIESSRGSVLTGVDSLATWWPTEQLATMRVLDGQRQISSRSADSADWLKITPLETIASIDHQWDVRLLTSDAEWQASSVVSVMRGEVRALHLASTVPFEMDSIVLREAGGQVPVSYQRLSPEEVLLVLPQPQRTTFTLEAKGKFRVRAGEATPLPVLSYPEFTDSNYRGSYSRAADLQLQVWNEMPDAFDQEASTAEPESATEVSPQTTIAASSSNSAAGSQEELDRFADEWINERQAELQGKLQDTANWARWRCQFATATYPKLNRSLTRFDRDGEGWLVALELQVASDDPWGADWFDVLLPEGFSPLATAGAGNWSNRSTSPANPFARWTAERRIAPGETAILRGRLTRFPDGRVLPRVLAANEIPRIVELPTAGPNDPFLWKYDGYRPLGAEAVANQEAAGESNPSPMINRLRLQEDDPSATLRLASKPLIARPSRVFLAEHRISLTERGSLITSRFLLDPGGRSRIRLILPPDLVPLRIEIDGEPRQLDPSGALELTSRELPLDIRMETWRASKPLNADSNDEGRQAYSRWWDFSSALALETQANDPPSASPIARDSQFPSQPSNSESVSTDLNDRPASVQNDATQWDWWRLPQLDVPVAETVVALRPSSSQPKWRAMQEGEPIDARQWRKSLEGATDEVRRSLATVAGLSPLAMQRWSAAWITQTPAAQTESTLTGPQLVIDDRTGEVIWMPAQVLWPTSFSSRSSMNNAFRAQTDLPNDANGWQVWKWKTGTAGIAPLPPEYQWKPKAITSLGLIAFALIVGLGVRWLPVSLPNWIDAGCALGGLAWVLTIEPAMPGVALILVGVLPSLARLFWRAG